jgi:hypothetical protein
LAINSGTHGTGQRWSNNLNEQQIESIKAVALVWNRYCELAENAESDITVEDYKNATYAVLVLENEGLILDFEPAVYSEIEKVGEKLKSLLETMEEK